MTDLEQAAQTVLEAWDDDDEGRMAEAVYHLGLAVATVARVAQPKTGLTPTSWHASDRDNP
jgi:hypothetical protein